MVDRVGMDGSINFSSESQNFIKIVAKVSGTLSSIEMEGGPRHYQSPCHLNRSTLRALERDSYLRSSSSYLMDIFGKFP